jgi:hypothetical protein
LSQEIVMALFNACIDLATTPMTRLHHSGSITVTIHLTESEEGFRYGLDTREGNGCGISSGRSRLHLTRASAIDAAVSWVRRFHGADVGPGLSAWLDGLGQRGLFEVAA